MTWLQTWIINQDPVALVLTEKGGPGSGNWGHAGVKGQRGGSAPKSGWGSAMSLATGKDWEQRQRQAKQQALMDQARSVMDAEKVTEDYFVAEVTVKPKGGTTRRAINWRKVNGESVSGSSGLDLFLHEVPTESGKPKWAVTEARTGTSVSGVQTTKTKALKVAQDTLSKVGLAGFKKKMLDFLERTADQSGLVMRSPRYGGKNGTIVGKPLSKGMWG